MALKDKDLGFLLHAARSKPVLHIFFFFVLYACIELGTEQMERKKAFVTGGERGIGSGIVKALAKEGYDVAFSCLENLQNSKDFLEDRQIRPMAGVKN